MLAHNRRSNPLKFSSKNTTIPHFLHRPLRILAVMHPLERSGTLRCLLTW